jgi:hypothetical protein
MDEYSEEFENAENSFEADGTIGESPMAMKDAEFEQE